MQSDKLKYLPAVITEPELLSPDRVFHVAGRNWSSMNVRRMVCLEGGTVREILIEVLRRSLGNEPTAFQVSVWLNRCRCKVDGVEISAEKWAVFKPQAGSFVEFLVSPGKGGGGKNVLSSVLMVAVMVASVFTAGAATAAAAGLLGAEFAGGTIYGAAATSFVTIGAASASAGALAVGALAGMTVMTLGTYALGKICPTVTSPQQAISTSAAKSSQTYSITGSQNAVTPFGYVPLVLGKYRFAGPLGAKSWTKQVGDDQYFNMLVVWGHPDMTVTDFRIGDTPLGEFKDVTHVFHGSTTGNDLQYFGKSYSENSVGATLKYNEPVTRVVGECDSISVDIYSPAMADVSSGHASSASASFKIEYAPVGTENWQTYAESTKFFAPAQYVDCYTGAGQNDAWATTDGTWHVRQSDSDWGIPDWTAGKIQASDPHWNPYPIERYKDKHKHHEWWFRDSWYDAGTSTTLTISAAQTTPLTRTYEWAVPHGEYQVRVTRMSPESDRDTLYNDITWSIMRAVVNQPAFNTPIPICVSELCIRASEQLSGYVDNFNALCCSRLPVYNEEAGGWIKDSDGEDVVDETQNPADHLRYLLTSRHALNSPYSFAKVDETALAAFAAYCKMKDYHFDFVCDTEASAWTRWTAAASAGRGAVTTDNDGLFGVTVDNAEKTPVQMFTPRNSWGFSIERSYYTMPHALRVSFYDETEDYEEKEGFIYADGYDKTTATDIVEWNFTGKTRWEDLYKMGRYYLASMRLRPITVTLSTDWEWMMCRRGDVVGVAHDVLMNTFGTARVVSLIYQSAEGSFVYVNREEDKPADGSLPVGVRLDDSVHFSEDAAYGIAIRQSSGKLLTYQITHTLNDITEDMMFANAITEAQVPYIGALASVSTLGSEYAEYLVASISVNSDNSAELTLVPWAMPEILNAESGEIPEWEPVIKLPTIGNKNKLPAPVIREIRSDESVLVRSGDAILSQIAVWWILPSGIPAEFKRLYVQLRVKDSEGNVFSNSVDVTTADYVAVQGVEDGREYTVYLRLVSDTGVTSEWTEGVTETVIGKSNLPPNIEGFTATLKDPEGVLLSWEPSQDVDVSYYEISGDASGKTLDTSLVVSVFNRTGELTFSIVAVDSLGQKSPSPASASATVLPPKTAVITSARLLDEGVSVLWQSAKSTWSIDRYQLTMGDASVFSAGLKAVVAASSPFLIGQSVTLRAQDIFRNWGEESEPFTISVLYPKTPDIVLGYDKLNGTVTVDWQDCRNAAAGSPAIDRYEIDGTLANQNSKDGLVTVKGTHYEAVVPLTAYEYGSQEDEDGTLVNVGTLTVSVRAVDKYGISNQDDPGYQNNEIQLSIWPPYNPTNMAIAASEEGDSIILSWKDCTRTFAIDYYLVKDSMTGRTYKVSTNYVVLPPRKAGSYAVAVQAFDVIGHSSAAMTYNMAVAGVGGMTVTAKVDGSDILVEWSIPESAFVVDHYIIKSDNDVIPNEDNVDLVGTAKVNYLRVPAGAAGQYVFYVWAVDVAGNISSDYASYASVTVQEPGAPTVSAELDGDGVTVKWALDLEPGQLPVRAWDVVRQWAEGGDETQTREMDYGRLDVDTTTVPAFSAGEHSFMVRAIDNGGNVGPWGFVDFVARAPGRVTFTQPVVIDNNVQLYWNQPPQIFFPIREYIFSEVESYEDGSEYEAEIGRVDALFASETEEVAGTYTYAITPVDVGGNVGQRSIITCRVAQPPDFVFYDKKESLFNGTKVNFELDGEGHMLGPVPMDENWLENVLRVQEAIGELQGDYEGVKVQEYGGKTWLRLYYIDAGEGGSNPLPENKEEAWNCAIGSTYFSKLGTLRDNDTLFRQPDGTLEFLAFQSDETGPITGDSSIYSQWTQTENPCLVQYENTGITTTPLASYKSIAKIGTQYPYGMALSTSGNTLIDGQPYHANYYGAVGQIRYHQNASPYLTVQRYAQLWIRIDGTDIGDAIDALTHQQKVNAGYKTWLEPAASSGSYTETIDHGTTIPSCNYKLTMGYRVLSGNPVIECRIEVSQDGKVWDVASDNAFSVYVTQFRYSRFTITVTGGYIEISSIYVDLNVKQISDYGRVECRADDNGDGWVSETKTPMLTGTWIPFNRDFVDVQSLPKPNVVNHAEYTAYTVFEDVINPEGFRVFVKDKNGSRVTATVDWVAMGV